MGVRLSTLAEIKALSLPSFLRQDGYEQNDISKNDLVTELGKLRTALGSGSAATIQSLKSGPRFSTIGIARNCRIDDDFGTTAVYGIGSPTRPRMVPNNASVNVSIDRLQLDRRRGFDFLTSPEYWYNDDVQREIGIDDFILYTYLFIRSKEDSGAYRSDIYALMPRTSSVAVTSGDVMVVNSVSMTGFKYSYQEMVFDVSNMVDESLTTLQALGTANTSGA